MPVSAFAISIIKALYVRKYSKELTEIFLTVILTIWLKIKMVLCGFVHQTGLFAGTRELITSCSISIFLMTRFWVPVILKCEQFALIEKTGYGLEQLEQVLLYLINKPELFN